MDARRIEVLEITFREWIVCKVRKVHSAVRTSAIDPARGRKKIFRDRSGRDRRADAMDLAFGRKEWRRLPERRMPEVNKASFDEFERWQK